MSRTWKWFFNSTNDFNVLFGEGWEHMPFKAHESKELEPVTEERKTELENARNLYLKAFKDADCVKNLFTVEEFLALEKEVGGNLLYIAVASCMDSTGRECPMCLSFEEVSKKVVFSFYVLKRNKTGMYQD